MKIKDYNPKPSSDLRESSLREDGTKLDSDGSRYDSKGNYIPFTKNQECPYPDKKRSQETCTEYKQRVKYLVDNFEFHLGDLDWSDYENYCNG